jgi:hypothetical protein
MSLSAALGVIAFGFLCIWFGAWCGYTQGDQRHTEVVASISVLGAKRKPSDRSERRGEVTTTAVLAAA